MEARLQERYEMADSEGLRFWRVQLIKHMRTPVIYDGAGLFRHSDKASDKTVYLIGTGYPDIKDIDQHSGK